MGDPLAEWRLLSELGVDMMWEKVTGVTGVNHYIGFGDRSAGGDALSPDHIIFVIFCSRHACATPAESSNFLPPIVSDSIRDAR